MIVIEQKYICYNEFENDTYNNTATFLRGHWVNSSPPSAAYICQWIQLA